GRFKRAMKWARRRPAAAALAVVSAVALLAVVAGSVFYSLYASMRADAAVSAAALAENKMKEAKKLAALEVQVHDLLAEAKQAVQGKEWQKAGDLHGKARALIGNAPELHGFQADVDGLAIQLGKRKAEQKAYNDARAKYENFKKWWNEALFIES